MSLPIDLAQLSKESVILKQINRNYPNWNAKRKKKEWKTKGGGGQSIRQLWETVSNDLWDILNWNKMKKRRNAWRYNDSV